MVSIHGPGEFWTNAPVVRNTWKAIDWENLTQETKFGKME